MAFTIKLYCASVENIEDIKNGFCPSVKITFKIKKRINTTISEVIARRFSEEVNLPKEDCTITLKQGECITAENVQDIESELKPSQFVLIEVWANESSSPYVRAVYLEDSSKKRESTDFEYGGYYGGHYYRRLRI